MYSFEMESLVEKDLKIIKKLDRIVKKISWATKLLAASVSKSPYRDACSIIWVIASLGSYFIGFNHYFVVASNLMIVAVLRTTVTSRIPYDYDRRMKPKTNIDVGYRGFPSLESYMVVVVLIDISYQYRYILLWLLNICIIAFIGFTRIYSKIRFPYQIIISWLLGVIGWIGMTLLSNYIQVSKFSMHTKCTIIGFFIAGYLCYICYAIEQNTSRLMHIPKTEYIRVLRDIVDISQDSLASQSTYSTDKSYMENKGNKDDIVLHDSFYYLQRNLERQARNKRKKVRS